MIKRWNRNTIRQDKQGEMMHEETEERGLTDRITRQEEEDKEEG